MTLSRRRMLAALAAGLLAGRATGDSRDRTLPITQRWKTGNRTLAPVSALGNRFVFAGDERLGVVSLDPSRAGWSIPHDMAGPLVFRPRLGAGLVVCGGGHGLAAWAIDDGAPRWRYGAKRQAGTPLLQGGRVYFGDGHEIVAVDLATGRPAWRFPAVEDTLASYAPAGAGDTVFAGPGDGRLYALSALDGSVRWTLDRSEEWQYLRQIHVSGDVLVAGSYKEKLYGIGIARGEVRWEFNAGNFINSHHVAGGTAYLWSPTGWLYAIEAATGAMRWRHRTTDYGRGGGNWGPLMAELVTHDGLLYALTLSDVLHVLDTRDGRETGRFPLAETVRPFVLPLDGGGLVFGSAGGEILLAGRT